jgi:DNA polymerase III subunit delta'
VPPAKAATSHSAAATKRFDQAFLGHQQLWHQLTHTELFPALLFSGAASIGKKMVAVQFAAHLNCQRQSEALPTCKPDQSVSELCSSCRRIFGSNHPDVRIWGREEGKLSLGIGEMRDLIDQASTHNYEAQFRVNIIDDAHTLTEEAQNALLKTLEEPNARQLLIMVTHKPEALIPTIRSRCRSHRFQPLSAKLTQQHLEHTGVGSVQAKLLAHLCEGCLGAALDLAEHPSAWSVQEEVFDRLAQLPGQSLWGSLESAKSLELLKVESDTSSFASSRLSAEYQLSLVRLWLIDLMRLNQAGPELVVLEHRLDDLGPLAASNKVQAFLGLLEKLHQWQQSLQSNVNPRFVWQNLCIHLARELCPASK